MQLKITSPALRFAIAAALFLLFSAACIGLKSFAVASNFAMSVDVFGFAAIAGAIAAMIMAVFGAFAVIVRSLG